MAAPAMTTHEDMSEGLLTSRTDWPGDSLRDSTYGPENLKLIGEAFDRAWEAIRPVVDDTPLAHEAARLKLANMILGLASSHTLDQVRAKQSSTANPAGAADTI